VFIFFVYFLLTNRRFCFIKKKVVEDVFKSEED
jgi:hypothetical protein